MEDRWQEWLFVATYVTFLVAIAWLVVRPGRKD